MRENPHFELTGGALCLDYANVVKESGDNHVEDYGEVVLWGIQTGAITREVADRLLEELRARPDLEGPLLMRALELRGALRGIFSAIAGSRPAEDSDLQLLNRELASATAEARLVRAGDGFAWGWSTDEALGRVLWPVVWSAAELLTSDRACLVHECAGEDCQWLFLDGSKNHSRQWCDMKVCGNRAKARRYAQRKRAAAGRVG